MAWPRPEDVSDLVEKLYVRVETHAPHLLQDPELRSPLGVLYDAMVAGRYYKDGPFQDTKLARAFTEYTHGEIVDAMITVHNALSRE